MHTMEQPFLVQRTDKSELLISNVREGKGVFFLVYKYFILVA